MSGPSAGWCATGPGRSQKAVVLVISAADNQQNNMQVSEQQVENKEIHADDN